MGIVLGGNYPGGNCPGGNCPGWELSWVGIVLGGNYPGGSCLGGNCLGGNCPVTICFLLLCTKINLAFTWTLAIALEIVSLLSEGVVLFTSL